MPINYTNSTQKIACLGWVAHANWLTNCIEILPNMITREGANPGESLWVTLLIVCIKKGNQI